MGEKWVKTHFSPTLNPSRDFRENPLFTQFKGRGNRFLKRALKQSRPSIKLWPAPRKSILSGSPKFSNVPRESCADQIYLRRLQIQTFINWKLIMGLQIQTWHYYFTSIIHYRLLTCGSSWNPRPNPRNPFGISVTWSAINFGKSVTMSAIGGFSGLQIPTLLVSELISVTDSGIARGLLQGRPLQLPMGWGVGDELTKS